MMPILVKSDNISEVEERPRLDKSDNISEVEERPRLVTGGYNGQQRSQRVIKSFEGTFGRKWINKFCEDKKKNIYSTVLSY